MKDSTQTSNEQPESQVVCTPITHANRAMDMEQGPDDEAKCPACEGDGGDKWSDYCLPCSMCGGDGRLW